MSYGFTVNNLKKGENRKITIDITAEEVLKIKSIQSAENAQQSILDILGKDLHQTIRSPFKVDICKLSAKDPRI